MRALLIFLGAIALGIAAGLIIFLTVIGLLAQPSL